MNKFLGVFTFFVGIGALASLYAAELGDAKFDSTRFVAIDTLHWNYATATYQLMNPQGDTIPTVSSAKWMIRYLAHPDSSLPDTTTGFRFLLMSYSSLSRLAVPPILPQLLDGINHDRKGIRNLSVSGIFLLALSHDKSAQHALDSLGKNAKWEDIQKQAAYFLVRIDRYKKMGVQY